jgi:hypothetical protein
MRAYVVHDEARGYCCWLVIDGGPFRYVRWTGDRGSATPMTLAQASDYANAYGLTTETGNRTKLVPVDSMHTIGGG